MGGGKIKICIFVTFESSVKIAVVMMEIIETELIYHCPDVLVVSFKSEGILCFSNEIPDWEENEDVL